MASPPHTQTSDPPRRSPPPDFLQGMKDGTSASGPQTGAGRNDSGGAGGDQDAEGDHEQLTLGLPGDEETWKHSVLGKPDDWSDSLKAYARTLSSLAYPAGIFWGEELALLHNKAWTESGGKAEQGQLQRGSLTADAYSALTTALRGGSPRKIASKEFLRHDSKDKHEEYLVLISPLFVDGTRDAGGLLAQLLPRPQLDGQGERKASKPSIFGHPDLNEKNGKVDISQLGQVVDNVPLDEHPFFHRFAEMLPSGLAILDHRAQAVFVNQHFYQLTSHRGEDRAFRTWPQSIHSDDYDRVMNAYHEAFKSQKQLRTEFRAVGAEYPWRLLLLTPLGDENLQHVSLREYGGFICSVVDITSEKSAEISERKAAKEARERREQQERFIDMISHEIRNPLSAVLHCSEDIEEAVRDENHVDMPAIRDALDTIEVCISHQRNIVDDVLSYSKLDASMLSLVPRACQPSKQLANTLKMFQPELRKQGMQFGFLIDTSYEEFSIDWVLADMARIGQVLVNLISNAIKFTARGNGEKSLQVSLGACKDRPTSYPPNVVFFNSDDLMNNIDSTNTAEWSDGEPVYLLVAVKDTGIGISEEGQKKLFERFRQATPKTSDIYGGSGLGLNISRKLCHLHGGEIGVSAKEGSGSTFGFFFRVKRTSHPDDSDGRPEEDTIEREHLQSIVKEQGNESPDNANPSDMPESLKNPPVKRAQETTPHPKGEKDELYKQTAKVDGAVKDEPNDGYQSAQSSHQVTERQRSANTPTGRADASGNVAAGGEGPLERRGSSSKNDRANFGQQGGMATGEGDRKRHVLLVEDNAINQKIVHRKLTSKGFDVTTASNGREAVEAVRNAPKPSSGDKGAFDVILMDQEMPILDGNGATREIRDMEASGKVERVPILGVTANVRGEQRDDMVQCGMDDVINKPYKIEDMIKKINQVMMDNTKTAAEAEKR